MGIYRDPVHTPEIRWKGGFTSDFTDGVAHPSREKEQSGYMQVVRWVDDSPNHPDIVACRMPPAINPRPAEPQVPINMKGVYATKVSVHCKEECSRWTI